MLVKLPLHYIDPSGTASATAAVTGDRVTSINVTSGGTGYDLTPNVAISGDGGVNAAATAHLSGGSVTSITVESGGSGYTSTPTVTIDPPYVRVPGPLGQPNPSGAPVLIRNTQFAASPDANSSQFQTWQIVGSDLPLNTRGFWVSGGHSNPVYYAYTINEATGNRLYRRNGSGTGWSLLSVTGLLPGGWHGPAFVNPYNPNRVFVLTSSGIKVSTDGGANFQNDTALTALLTASGKFPLTGTFNGGNGNYVVAGNHGVPMGTLSHMAFDRSQPSRMVAASPFTGVFYDNGSGTWTDLTGLLPKPLAPVSAVGISGPSIYAATQGRGLLRILLDDSSHCFLTGPVLKVGPVDPYHTVRDAYNAVSQDCTTISISAGTYHEAPFPLNKYVRLESRGGAATIGR